MKGSAAILTLFLATVVTSAPVGHCPAPEDGGYDVTVGPYLADDRNASVYYECINGVAYDDSCGQGLSFDAATTSCVARSANYANRPFREATPSNLAPEFDEDLDTDVDPDNSVETSEGRDPSKGRCLGTCPTDYPDTHVKHLPHERDCSLFCKCNHGKPILFLCPDGLYFNRYLEVCDWPAHSRCTMPRPL